MSERPTVWHTYKTAAAYLQIRPITLKRAVDAGKLRAFRLQRAVRFRLEDLDAWLTASPVQPEVRSRRPHRNAARNGASASSASVHWKYVCSGKATASSVND